LLQLRKELVQETETSHAGPICPFCRMDLSWDNLKFIEMEASIYLREKVYYCPACRAFLGASSWHTEG